MTGKGKRLDALEAVARQREDSAARAYLEGLTDQELQAAYVAVLRRAGHADPEGEAGRIGAAVAAMTDEQLQAAYQKLTP